MLKELNIHWSIHLTHIYLVMSMEYGSISVHVLGTFFLFCHTPIEKHQIL